MTKKEPKENRKFNAREIKLIIIIIKNSKRHWIFHPSHATHHYSHLLIPFHNNIVTELKKMIDIVNE